jgi:hypothetical protein
MRDVSLQLLTQFCLPGSFFPMSLPWNLCSPHIHAFGRLGIYSAFITIPPQDPAPFPAAVKTTHSYPAERQATHWGKLLEIMASSGQKVLPNCPSPGDKSAKYNAKWKTEVRLAHKVGGTKNQTPCWGDREDWQPPCSWVWPGASWPGASWPWGCLE